MIMLVEESVAKRDEIFCKFSMNADSIKMDLIKVSLKLSIVKRVLTDCPRLKSKKTKDEIRPNF